ncbi:MAG TPA: sugar phosphate isomerase/epimerase family protein [Vicinamibacteria bacterium]|nr:sugar phosphate isomerase/epimerase family protein [Vicinamibacteria bacterium]
MPKLAAFPKAWMQGLCKDGSLSLERWIEMAGELEIDGLEFYSGFLDLRERPAWDRYRRLAEERGLHVPMLCCSPDFTHPDPAYRRREVEKEKGWIEMAAALGCSTCRVLSGQRRPELTREDGLRFAAESIEACLPHAEGVGITLVIENHYKDDFWEFPEFAQKMDVFCDLVARVDSPHFGVNYDPSNTLLAGEDPLELLRRVRDRVVTMHASDRYLAVGTLEDLRREETSVGYAKRLRHGEIGKGLNDYDAIFSELRAAAFDGWISIEDGVEGMDQMRRSVAFLRGKMRRYWPAG